MAVVFTLAWREVKVRVVSRHGGPGGGGADDVDLIW